MRFLKLKEVMQKTALSRSTIYRKMNNDEFPKSICLGDRAVAWLEVNLLRDQVGYHNLFIINSLASRLYQFYSLLCFSVYM